MLWSLLICWFTFSVRFGMAAVAISRLDEVQLGCAVSNSSCNLLPTYLNIARLSQRDVSSSASITQVSTPGVSLGNVLFNKYGYTSDSIRTVESILDVGLNALVIDMYWSETNTMWQLCPYPFPTEATGSGVLYELENGVVCQDNVTLTTLCSSVTSYMVQSDSKLTVNPIILYLRLHSLPAINDTETGARGDSSLTEGLVSLAGPRIFQPADLANDRNDGEVTLNGTYGSQQEFPSLYDFLFTNNKRFMTFLLDDSQLYSNASYSLTSDYSVMFDMFDNQVFDSIGALNSSCALLSSSSISDSPGMFSNESRQVFRTVYETPTDQFSNVSSTSMVKCGYSLVFNSSLEYLDDLGSNMEESIWSWAPGEPDSQQNDQVASAYSCAVATPNGWLVANCYENLPVLCRAVNDSFDWLITADFSDYFGSEALCPDGYVFTTPQTALENGAVKLTLAHNSGSSSAWIDLNSIAVSNCWVTGGPSSQCPYLQTSYNRNTWTLLGVAVFFCLLLIAFMIILSFIKLPLHTNQGKWRRLVNKFAETEYEGVPS